MIAKDNLRKILVCLALAIGTALLYLPVLHFDFVNYDDPIYVINNYHIRTVSWASLAWCFQAGYAYLWHPLTWMSHILDYQLYGIGNPGGHHATSVLLHILNSLMLFLLLNRMTKAPWRSAVVAALFAWHPLHVESVAWISERKDVLSTFFWMLTVWAYARYAEEFKIQNSKSKIFYALALFFCACGLMSKPTLVTLPFVLLLLDWWPLGRMQIGSLNLNPNLNRNPPARDASPRRPEAHPRAASPPYPTLSRLLMEKVPFLALSIAACVLTLKASSRIVEPLTDFTLLPRVVNGLLTYFRYIEKMIWPTDMVAVYPVEFHWSGLELLMALLTLTVISIVAVRLWKARPFWLVGWLLYLGIMVPVIGIIQVGAQTMADHYTYLSSIGIFIIICWESWDIAINRTYGAWILGTAAAVVLGACCVVSHNQLEYWRNPATIHLHTIDVMPNNPTAHADYAAYLRDIHQLPEAQKESETAIRLAPDFAFAHQVLGGVFFLEGKYDDADKELRIALRLAPSRVDVHLPLGMVALARHQPLEAASQYRALIEAEPGNPSAHLGLGEALLMQGRLDDAGAQLNEALRVAPQYPEAHLQLAIVLAKQDKTDGAVAQYRLAGNVPPAAPDSMVLNNLAWILAASPSPELRNGVEAVKLAERACELDHKRQPVLIGTLAAAYAEAGRFDDAVAAAQQAHDLALELAEQSLDPGEQEVAKGLAARNLELLAIYRSHQAFHEK